MTEKIEVALVASSRLGDATIFMVLAENLRQNGFSVTLYSNHAAQLAAWLPGIAVRKSPPVEQCDAEFAAYDLVFADYASVLAHPYQDEKNYPELAQKYLYLSLGRIPSELVRDHAMRLKEVLPPEKFERCCRLAGSAGELRFRDGSRTASMVECAVGFCRDVWGLKTSSAVTGMRPPPELNLHRGGHDRRILLHPFSSDVKKNWPLKKFIGLARRLRRKGWEPAFIVAPDEMAALRQAVGDEFPAPEFKSIGDLAAYIFESRAMVANDSGPGHLASALGLPILSISRKGKAHRWRPDFSVVRIVVPWFKFRIGKNLLWKPFLSVGRVRLALEQLLEHS